jgi:hypothetical protein
MSVIEEIRKPALKKTRENKDLFVIETSKFPFKVVVNNYRQQVRETVDKIMEEDDETTVGRQQGLPPQPTEYLKFPDHDWF